LIPIITADENGDEIELKADDDDDYPGIKDENMYQADDNEIELGGYTIEEAEIDDLDDSDDFVEEEEELDDEDDFSDDDILDEED
jgi:hypothetical protein